MPDGSTPPALPRRGFAEEHRQVRDRVARLLERDLVPQAAAWRAQGHVDPAAYRVPGRNGLLPMWARPGVGGAGLRDPRFARLLREETVRLVGAGFARATHSMPAGPCLDRLATPAQKARLLPPAIRGKLIPGLALAAPGAGGDLAATRTRAEDRGDHWLLDGRKTCPAQAIIGGLHLVAARTGPAQALLSLFLVEAARPGLVRGHPLRRIALPERDTAELVLRDLRPPKENLLGSLHRGLAQLARCLVPERPTGAITALAQATAACDIPLGHLRLRDAPGHPAGTSRDTRFRMAGLRAERDATQCFVDDLVVPSNDGGLTAELAAEARVLATGLANRVMDAAVHLHGGAGFMEQYRISRMYRDSRISPIFGGSNGIMREIVGRGLGLDGRRAGGTRA